MALETFQPFAVALLIGLAVGIDRERGNREGEGTMGVRTFILIAMLGAVAGHLKVEALTGSLAAFVLALTVAGYWRASAGHRDSVRTDDEREDRNNAPDIGLTTEFAAAAVFAVAYLAESELLIAGALGIVLATTLFARSKLHEFSRQALRANEIQAALTLAVFAFVILPFIPNDAVDPWNLVNPRNLAQVIVVLAGLEFGGYAVSRLIGKRAGLLATGLFGGIASSTAVFVSMAKLSKEGETGAPAILGACLLATASTMALFVAIVVSTASTLAVPVGVPAVAAATSAALIGLFLGRKGELQTNDEISQKSPLDVQGVLKLSAFVIGLLVATAAVKVLLGEQAVKLVSFVSGLFELHGVTYANAALFAKESISARLAIEALLLAAVSSYVSKIFICWSVGSRLFAMRMTGLLLGVLAVGAAAYWIAR